MKLKLTSDKKFFKISSIDSPIEYEQLRTILTRKVANYRFIPAVKSGAWSGDISFIDSQDRIPVGLYQFVEDNMTKYKYSVEFEGLDDLFDDDIDYDEFVIWCNELFKDAEKKPRDYQLDGAFNILKNKRCCSLIATNGGKTLVTFIVFTYLLRVKNIKKILMVVPNTDLVIQATNDFYEYNHTIKTNLVIQQIYSGTERSVGCNIYIGTYQSLCKFDESYFKDFSCVMIDEVQSAKSESVSKICKKLPAKCEYRIGCSGTIPTDGAEYLTIISNTGPIVNTISNEVLINKGVSTPVKITVIKMNYVSDEVKNKFYELSKTADGKTCYETEKKYVITNTKRLKFVTDLIKSSTKNSLVLFHRIEYGKLLYKTILNAKKTNVFYIDGKVKIEDRSDIKESLENNTNVTLIASYGTFAVGISVNRINNIFLTESFKSQVKILQSLGRGLRLHKDKDMLRFIDLVDDFTYDTSYGFKYVNHLFKHHKERLRIYKQENFDVEIRNVNLG